MALRNRTVTILDDHPTLSRPQLLCNPSVTFAEYRYYADRTRADEQRARAKDLPTVSPLRFLFKFNATTSAADHSLDTSTPPHDLSISMLEREGEGRDTLNEDCRRMAIVTASERTNASRALRNMSTAGCFYLVTFDVYDPVIVPFAIGSMGWVFGILLLTIFSALAAYSGYLLHKVFLGLDSHEYPCKTYADLVHRLYGRVPHILVSVLQSILIFLFLGSIIIVNGQQLSQVVHFRLCYVVCCLVWAVCGFALGQIRTLRMIGSLAGFALVFALVSVLVGMIPIALFEPNYGISLLGAVGSIMNPSLITPTANGTYPSIVHDVGLPKHGNLAGILNGFTLLITAFAGGQLFVEFMAEMRQPVDFLKVMWIGQLITYIVNILYGCFVYHFQGQYTFSVSYLGISRYGWQLFADILGMMVYLLGGIMWGNIGCKVLYSNVAVALLNAPGLSTKRGKLIWRCLVPLYWSCAYVVAGSIPYFAGIVGVVSALCLVQFTYTFPAILAVGYRVMEGALQPGEGYDPLTGSTIYHDRGWARWKRGFARHKVFSTANVVYIAGCLAIAGLGLYASIASLVEAFEIPQVVALGGSRSIDQQVCSQQRSLVAV